MSTAQLHPTALPGRAPRKRAAPRRAAARSNQAIVFDASRGVKGYVSEIATATPVQIVEIERQGVQGTLIKALSRTLGIPAVRLFEILGVPKATAEKKASAGTRVSGSGGIAAIGMVKLIAIAEEIVADSTSPEAKDFDAGRWLGQWIERPQPALGGRKPAEFLDTPTGVGMVARLLGSIASGAYQ